MEISKALIALIPIIWLLISLGVVKMAIYKACIAASLITAVIAFTVFDMPINLLGQSILEGSVYAVLSICWIVVAALLVYNITLKTGALDIIKGMLTNISSDRRIQALIIAFAFGGFLEAVAGFGTAVAIPAGILIAMGFPPLKAAIVCLVSNTVPVAMGVLGVPVFSLAEASGLQDGQLAFYMCIQLLPFCIFLPLLIMCIVTDDIKKIRGVIIPSLLSGLAFALGQMLVVVYIGITLAATIGSLCALLVLILWCRLFGAKATYRWDWEEDVATEKEQITFKTGLNASCPYILILVLIFTVQFLPVLSQPPFLLSHQFYFGENGKSLTFNWLTNGGTLLFIAAIIGGLLQKMRLKEIFITLKETLVQVKISILTTVLVVVFAKIMTYSGMIGVSATLIAALSSGFFPFISPIIGALGTFVTGSDTSSNILFGGLQQQTASNLNMNPYWIVAANGAGATAGKMISPQSISIAAASINNAAKESDMIKATFKYCILYVILMGACIFAGHTLL